MLVPGDLIREIKERIGGFALILYGATEMAATTITLPMDPAVKQEETVGHIQSLGGVEVRVVDDDRAEVEPGVVGEIAVRASMMMEGYYRRPEATAAAVDKEGWYYSGDLGAIDDDGYLRVLGRRGDMIIRAGANVYPAEIENFLLGHPDIEKVAVIGLPGAAATGERVRAYIVPKEGATLTEGDVIGYCWGKIAAFKVPNEVVFADALPVTSALRKVQHYKLRQQALGEDGGE
jgi:fatty-acyl-CoA synthase/long-chain acyl-CoA synthetase